MLRDSAEEVDVVSFQKEDHWRQGWGGQGGSGSLRKGVLQSGSFGNSMRQVKRVCLQLGSVASHTDVTCSHFWKSSPGTGVYGSLLVGKPRVHEVH